MTRHRTLLLLLGLIVCARPAQPAVPRAESTLVSTRALIRRLRASGRAEAEVRTTVIDPLTGARHTLRGTLALELPHFARLDFATGERLALRADGGEWLQPEVRQLIQAGPQSTGAILDWWGVLLEQDRSRYRETRPAPRGYRIRRVDAGDEEEGQQITLGADGLPVAIEVLDQGETSRRYRLSGWRFVRPRGAGAFVLAAPSGYDVVHMP